MSSAEATDRVAVLHPELPRLLDAVLVVGPDADGERPGLAEVAAAALRVAPDGTVPGPPTRSGPDGRLHVVVSATARTADGAAWVADPPSGLPDGVTTALRAVLAEDAGETALHPLRPGWHRRGWWDDVTAWVDEALADLQLAPRTGPLRPRQVWSMSAVVEVPTTTGRYWLKAVPPHFAREPAVIDGVRGASAPERAAGAALPGLPRTLASATEPGGAVRLLMTDSGPVPDDVLPGERERLTAGFARLQAATAPRLGPVAGRAGLDDRSPSALAAGLARLTAEGIELGRLTDAERTALAERLPRDRDRLLALAGTGLPPLLVHGDYHPWNAVRHPGWADGEEVAIDWTDASVGVAGLDLVPLAGLRSTGEVDAGPVVDAYVVALAGALGAAEATVRAAVTAALPAAWLVQALAYEGILRAAEPLSHHEFTGCQERSLRGWLRGVPADGG
ncbi:MAG: phosphotransferase [Actinobacteria bacterium]|nr:phosphotransferase [Actinomycetota bacterium]